VTPPAQDSKRIRIAGTAVVVEGDDIDTDRIIPARFLRCVTFDDLGAHAFEDDRKQVAERNGVHPFDDPARQAARILVVGKNFGCGSSREHAPQALMRALGGIAAVVGESFAEIFFGNCVAIGIPCVTAAAEDVRVLARAVDTDATLAVTVDLEALRVRFGAREIVVHMADGPRGTLTSGRWDTTGELLEARDAIARTARALPYFGGWA
jgi:3-isopropylmalate/(R)-2-methylmalate dehydratase small subunit